MKRKITRFQQVILIIGTLALLLMTLIPLAHVLQEKIRISGFMMPLIRRLHIMMIMDLIVLEQPRQLIILQLHQELIMYRLHIIPVLI